MKSGNIFLLIITSILTVIGLGFSKLYTKYVKENIVVQISLYGIWTILSLRVLYWVAKPIIKSPLCNLTNLLKHVTVNFEMEPSISVSILLLIFTLIILFVVRQWIKDITE